MLYIYPFTPAFIRLASSSSSLAITDTYARFLNERGSRESRVTPGLRKKRVLETSNPGVNIGASKMAAHFDDDSLISSAAYSY